MPGLGVVLAVHLYLPLLGSRPSTLSLKPGDSLKFLSFVFSQSDSFVLFECTVFGFLLIPTTVICTIDKEFIDCCITCFFFYLGGCLGFTRLVLKTIGKMSIFGPGILSSRV